jgi:hypothetical protein
MEMAVWALQWVVSLVGVGAYCVILYHCFKEFGAWAIAFLLFPPALLFFYAPTRWQRCKSPLLAFVVCVVVAMLLQRARLGHWAWPDVERGAQQPVAKVMLPATEPLATCGHMAASPPLPVFSREYGGAAAPCPAAKDSVSSTQHVRHRLRAQTPSQSLQQTAWAWSPSQTRRSLRPCCC